MMEGGGCFLTPCAISRAGGLNTPFPRSCAPAFSPVASEGAPRAADTGGPFRGAPICGSLKETENLAQFFFF